MHENFMNSALNNLHEVFMQTFHEDSIHENILESKIS